MNDGFDDSCSRSAFEQRDGLDGSAVLQDCRCSGDFIYRPVGSLDQNVRQEHSDKIFGRIVFEQRYCIDYGECRKHFCPVILARNRPVRPLEPSDRCVGVQPDNQPVAEPSCGSEVTDVAGMKDIETPVREYNLFPFRLPGSNFQERLVMGALFRLHIIILIFSLGELFLDKKYNAEY
jgi:hypothetical protein